MNTENRDFLDEHFATAPAVAETAETTEEVVGEEVPEEQQEHETAETAPAQPQEAAAEVTATSGDAKDPSTVPYAAMKAEREKRQRLERELEELRNQQPQQPVPTYYEDPEGYVQRIQNESTQRLYAALEASAREQYPDYDEAFGVVMQHAQGNPALVQEVMSSPNPAVAAYKMGKKLAEFEKMKDPDAYRAQIEAEVRAKVEAEVAAKTQQRQKVAAEIPPDLSQARNTRGEFAAAPDVFKQLF